MHGAGRSERARVAERVRAVLAEAGHARAAPHEVAVGQLSDDVAAAQPSLLARLAARRPVRVDPGRRGAVAVGVAALLAAVLTGWWVWSARPHSVPVQDHPPVSPSPSVAALAGSAAASPSTSPVPGPPALVVDVEGKVRRPGLYRLPSGSRVADAIHAAGGVRNGADTTLLNLAARVSDGQQIAVDVPGATVGPDGAAAGTSGGSGAAGTVGPTAPVDLNSASLDQLETLPGVGPVLGQHILDWRDAHGSFTSVGQLDDVPGIGPAKFGELKGLVTV